jgi:hypothetical protein
MATVTHHLNARGGLRRTAVIVVAAVAAAMATSCDTSRSATSYPPIDVGLVSQTLGSVRARPTYSWPLKPFDRPHPVRAYLNDPRILGSARSFHFGIDISVPKGRQVPVYAVESGTASLVNAFAIMVRGARHFEYWHVIPAVRPGEYVRRHQLIGTSMGWNHIHFAEYAGGHWINPLRPGGLGPYSDETIPTVTMLTFERNGAALDLEHVTGTGSLVLDAFDTASSVTPAPWPVTPALIRWRVLHNGRPLTGWKGVLDSRQALPKDQFDSVYAAGTAQNHPGIPGRYRFLLAPRWSTQKLTNGRYIVEVQAADIRRNSVTARISLTVENGL